MSLDSGVIIHTGFLAFHTILDILLPAAVLPGVHGFPVLAVLRPLRPTVTPSAAGWPIPMVLGDSDSGSQVPCHAVNVWL